MKATQANLLLIALLAQRRNDELRQARLDEEYKRAVIALAKQNGGAPMSDRITN